jgi:hypothetical protein
MRAFQWIALSIAFLFVAGAAATPAQAAVDVSFGFFYSNLSPHGSWFVSASHGRVWRPHLYAHGWHPYYDGRWAYTDLGWCWVSDYPWGGIPYHYGTWVFDPVLGWVWVPGYVWAPAWVVFRTAPGYIGWTPVPFAYSIGVGVRLTGYRPEHYVFVPTGDFLARRIRPSALPPGRARTIIGRTTIVNNIRVENNVVVNRGPDVRVIEKAHGARIRPRSIERIPKAGPAWRVSRDELRLPPGRPGARLRAAEPLSEREFRRHAGPPGRSERGPAATRRDETRRRERPPADDGGDRQGARDRRGPGDRKKEEDRPKPGARSRPRDDRDRKPPRDQPE